MANEEITKTKLEIVCGSNVIKVNGETKYLNCIIWNKETKYEDIKDKVVLKK